MRHSIAFHSAEYLLINKIPPRHIARQHCAGLCKRGRRASCLYSPVCLLLEETFVRILERIRSFGFLRLRHG